MTQVIFLNGIYGIESVTPTVAARQHNRTLRGLGPYILKSWIKQNGFTSQVIDFCHLLTAKEIIDLVEHFIDDKTLCLGISTTYMIKKIPAHISEVLSYVKQHYPHIELIAGGAESEIADGKVDRVFYGDAEDQMMVYLRTKTKTLDRSLFDKKFNIVTQCHRFDERDAILENEVLPLELGRGCIFKCKFCGYDKIGKAKNTYQRNFSNILDEIKYNKEKFGVTRYVFIDSTVNEDAEKVYNLSTISDHLGFNIEWTGFLRADLIWSNPDTAEYLKKSGLKSAFFGIESFDHKAASSIGKGWSHKHAQQFLPKLYNEMWEKKISIQTGMIVGLPGEDKESVLKSAEWFRQHNFGMAFFQALHLNYGKSASEFTRNPEEHGYTVEGNEWTNEHFTYQSAQELSTHINENILTQNSSTTWTLFSTANLYPEKTIDELMYVGLLQGLELRNKRLEHFKTRYITKLKEVAANLK